MNKYYLLFSIPVLIAVFSCSKKISGITLDPDISKDFYINEFKFDYFTLKSKINLIDDGKKQDATVLFRIKKDSIIWFNISGSLGIQGMRGILTKDSVKILNRVGKEYSEYDYNELSRLFKFNLSYDLIEAIIVGNPPRKIEAIDEAKLVKDQFWITQKENQYNILSKVNSATRRLQEVTVTEDSTGNKLNLEYKNFQMIEQQVFPFSCNISLIYETNNGIIVTKLNIIHNKVEIPDKPLKYPFNIPNKYERNK